MKFSNLVHELRANCFLITFVGDGMEEPIAEILNSRNKRRAQQSSSWRKRHGRRDANGHEVSCCDPRFVVGSSQRRHHLHSFRQGFWQGLSDNGIKRLYGCHLFAWQEACGCLPHRPRNSCCFSASPGGYWNKRRLQIHSITDISYISCSTSII